MFAYQSIIRELRERQGLLQRDVADIIGMSQRAYSFYETGGREISISVLLALASFYHVPTDFILGLTDTKEPYPK